jgi:phage terminase small subunit
MPSSNIRAKRKPIRTVPHGMESPLDYMLRIVNDPSATDARRDRLAIAASPYCHGRIAEVGKKQKQAEAAKTAGQDNGWADDLDYAEGELKQ